jgi:hypothetical protein
MMKVSYIEAWIIKSIKPIGEWSLEDKKLKTVWVLESFVKAVAETLKAYYVYGREKL